MEETDDFLMFGDKRAPAVDSASQPVNGNQPRKSSMRKTSIFAGGRRRMSRRRTTIVINFEPYSFVAYDELVEICQDNRDYFESDDSDMGQRFHNEFICLLSHIDTARKQVTEINGFAHEYDYDERTPGNGYRSLVKAMHAAIEYCIRVSSYIAKNRRYLLFRRSVYIK